VIGFVAARSLVSVETDISPTEDEDFVIFTTGINRLAKGNKLGQIYQTPEVAIKGGLDFIIAGRGIYAKKTRLLRQSCIKKRVGRPTFHGLKQQAGYRL
jgi:orotidine-5'-phosphate decarboxylase